MGGARNVEAGLEAARKEILTSSRAAAGLNVPVYLVHFTDYAHDIGEDPVAAAHRLASLNVKIFNVAIQSFLWDNYFQYETSKIVAAGTPNSRQYNVASYQALFESGLKSDFLNILKQFPCATTPPPTTSAFTTTIATTTVITGTTTTAAPTTTFPVTTQAPTTSTHYDPPPLRMTPSANL